MKNVALTQEVFDSLDKILVEQGLIKGEEEHNVNDKIMSKYERAYLALQHLYAMMTDKDPTNRDPFIMEQEIIHYLDNVADGISSELVNKLLMSGLDQDVIDRVADVLCGS